MFPEEGQTWNAWCAIASGMQESGGYVLSPLLFPTRLLWLDYPTDGDALGIVRPRMSSRSARPVAADLIALAPPVVLEPLWALTSVTRA
jgi:hypothetical protein